MKAVEELEALYEKKLALENDKYIDIELVLDGNRKMYEEEIKEHDRKHRSTIEEL